MSQDSRLTAAESAAILAERIDMLRDSVNQFAVTNSSLRRLLRHVRDPVVSTPRLSEQRDSLLSRLARMQDANQVMFESLQSIIMSRQKSSASVPLLDLRLLSSSGLSRYLILLLTLVMTSDSLASPWTATSTLTTTIVCSVIYFHVRGLLCILPYIDLSITKCIASSVVRSWLDYSNATHFGTEGGSGTPRAACRFKPACVSEGPRGAPR